MYITGMATNTNQSNTATAVPTNYPGNTADTPGAFVRYARCLKANKHYVAAYTSHAAKGAQQGKVQAALANGLGCTVATLPAYVVHNCTTGAMAGFATWAPAYAYSMAQAHTALAPSVVASLGKPGLGAVPVQGLTQRAPGAPATAPQ